MTRTTAQSVLILGGGPAGLTAAHYLAQRGLRVTLLDRASILGGSLTDESRPFLSIPGCHHATWRLLRSLGLNSDERIFQKTNLEFHLPDGRLVRYPHAPIPGPLRILFNIGCFAGFSWSERWRLLSWLEEIWEGSLKIATDLEHRTAQEWLTSLGYSESLQQTIWNPLARWLTENDLHVVSAGSFAASLASFFLQRSSDNRIVVPQQSPLTLLIKPISDRLAQEDAMITLETPAAEFQFEQDRVTGVRLRDGSVLQADWYLSAVPHNHLAALLPERWLSRFAYFQQLSELTTVSRAVVRIAAQQPLRSPRLILLSDKLFRRIEARSEPTESLFIVTTTEMPEQTRNVEQRAASLLQSLGLLHTSSVITAGRTCEIHDSFLSLAPGTKVRRPLQKSPIANLLVAGAWTDTGWPSNLESAIVSGERCANIISGHARPTY